jgi:hypothetical protein
MALDQVQQYMDYPIKDRAVLQHLSVKIVKYWEQAVEVKEILSSLMDQHRFLYTNTCKGLFIKWSEYDEKSHPLQ